MHWVYVLKSSQTGCIYIGETTRLYRRWIEHNSGRGGVNTSDDDYDTIIGLYSVSNNSSFLEFYDDMVNHGRYAYKCQKLWGNTETKDLALKLENHITERYFYEKRNTRWWDVCGGKYTTDEKCERFYEDSKFDNVLIDRPLCNCGYPCEVKMKNDKTKIYFICPVPEWVDGFNKPEKCTFWQEFEPYRKILESYIPSQSAREIFGIDN